MKAPKNQNAEVLFELIINSSMTRMNFFYRTGILNVTARIANLRNKYGVNVICRKIETLNKHGRKISYGSWSLDPKSLEFAKEVYNKINK